jgi:hypothetical protein
MSREPEDDLRQQLHASAAGFGLAPGAVAKAVETGRRRVRRRRTIAGTGMVLVLAAGGLAAGTAWPTSAPTVDVAAEMGSGQPADGTPPADEPAYDGPLFVQATQEGSDWVKRSGAAGRALQCDGPIYRGYMDGENTEYGGAKPENVLTDFLASGPNRIPDTGFRLARRDGDRVLFTYDVDGKTKVALIGVKRTSDVDSFGEPISKIGWPWTGESWAQCDPAEYHPSADAEHDSDIWSDADRPRVPVTEIESRPAIAHCWPGATILTVKKAGHSYLRDPQGTWPAAQLGSTYEADSTLPKDAVDTGYFHDDRHLWLAADKQAAYVVTPDRVERWPVISGSPGCM